MFHGMDIIQFSCKFYILFLFWLYKQLGDIDNYDYYHYNDDIDNNDYYNYNDDIDNDDYYNYNDDNDNDDYHHYNDDIDDITDITLHKYRHWMNNRGILMTVYIFHRVAR